MTDKILISGFADEIDSDFDTQLQVLNQLGMDHLCLRAADGKNIADYSVEEVEEKLLPRLQKAGIGVSSLGSPIGKVELDDEEGFEKQLVQLENLCQIAKVLGTKYIRIFSFFMPENENPDNYKDQVIEKLKKYEEIAAKNDIILIHENEKDIYGDTAPRCEIIFSEIPSDHLKAAFDFANFVQVGQNPMEAWDLLKDHVAYIHIKDAVSTSSENVLCGTGEGQIAEILKKAVDGGYEGFCTLEPHLVLFDSLQSLEKEDASDVIKENKYENGAEGFTAQLHALQDILSEI